MAPNQSNGRVLLLFGEPKAVYFVVIFCLRFLLRARPVPRVPRASKPNLEVDSGIDVETGNATNASSVVASSSKPIVLSVTQMRSSNCASRCILMGWDCGV